MTQSGSELTSYMYLMREWDFLGQLRDGPILSELLDHVEQGNAALFNVVKYFKDRRFIVH